MGESVIGHGIGGKHIPAHSLGQGNEGDEGLKMRATRAARATRGTRSTKAMIRKKNTLESSHHQAVGRSERGSVFGLPMLEFPNTKG